VYSYSPPPIDRSLVCARALRYRYVIGGNHDYCGDVTEQMKFSDANVRWNYPDYNHKIVREFPVDDGEHSTSVKIEIIMIDTIQLAGTNPCPAPTSEGGEFLSDGYYFELPPDPWNDDAALIRSRETLEWIEESLVGSDADYLLVAGHYGIYSACSHGNNPTLIRELDPLLRKHGVTAYLSGHDHCQFHFAHEGMNYILSGAGDYCCYGSENERHLPKGGEMLYLLADTHDYSGSSGVKGGFLSFDVGHDEMVVSIHRENGDTLHESILSPRGNTFRRKDGNVAVEEE
jgi:tartrate-resistant acid phosphatase type 5